MNLIYFIFFQSNFVAPSNSSHDLMNRLLSDDSLNHSDKSHSKIIEIDDKPKSATIMLGKSGKVFTLPPIEIPKTRSLVKKEVCILIKITFNTLF